MKRGDEEARGTEGGGETGAWGRRSSARTWPLIAGILLLLAAGGAWWWLRSAGTAGSGAGGGDGRDTVTATTSPADTAAARDLPGLGASDTLVRKMVATLSSHPRWTAWLATEDLVRTVVRAVVSVAAGRSPREELEFLDPGGDFRAREAGVPSVVDPDSYRRYDRVTEVFTSLDPEGSARLYRRLRPLFEQAYRELGFRESSFDVALARAVETLLAVPVPEGPIRVVPDGTVWEFRDPELQALSPAQQHLLRMGPENARRVQEKLRELAEALELPTVGQVEDGEEG